MNIGDVVEFYPPKRDRSLAPLIGEIINEDNHNDSPYKWNVVQFRDKNKTPGPDYHLQSKQLNVLTPKAWFKWCLANEDVV